MGQEIEDEDFSGVVVNGGDEAEGIAGDIEDSDGLVAGYADFIGMGKVGAGGGQVPPLCLLRHGQPVQQGGRGLGMLAGKFHKARWFDDTHTLAMSGGSWLGGSWLDYSRQSHERKMHVGQRPFSGQHCKIFLQVRMGMVEASGVRCLPPPPWSVLLVRVGLSV